MNRAEAIAEIYDAIGDPARWAAMLLRLGDDPTPDVQHHLAIARSAHQQQVELARMAAACSAVYAQLAIGALLVDASGALRHANDLGTRMLAEGMAISLVEDRIVATDVRDDAVLQAAIAGASDGAADRMPLVPLVRPGRTPLAVFVVPARGSPRTDYTRQRVLLLILDPEQEHLPAADVLPGLFGFTAREAECALLLMQGRTLEEAAGLMGIRRSTARTFLARMTAKTDSHGQTELVARLLAMPRLSDDA